MYKQEQIKPYEGEGEKGKLVEEMFDNIAPTYDTLNHRLSWDIDKGWRRKAIGLLQRHYPEKMLDIATGTGDFAILAAKMLHPQQLIGNLFAVLIHSLKSNCTVDLCVKGIIRALTYILAGMDVSTTLSNKDVACKNELTVCTLNAKTL